MNKNAATNKAPKCILKLELYDDGTSKTEADTPGLLVYIGDHVQNTGNAVNRIIDTVTESIIKAKAKIDETDKKLRADDYCKLQGRNIELENKVRELEEQLKTAKRGG
jgi:hypothetical protein